jgi:hypothetical protein
MYALQNQKAKGQSLSAEVRVFHQAERYSAIMIIRPAPIAAKLELRAIN